LDAVQWAVTTLGSVVGQSLVDVAAADVVLQNQRILLILDNLEVYVTEKQETLQELLTVAQQWSLLGETRILITTRPVELGHEAYQKDSENFRQLKLEGLGKEDALHYFEQLLILSNNPVRLQTDELLRWFAKVQFHPLSIGLLARSLETEDLENLEGRLNQLMLELPDNPVAATLQLVIEQLDEESRGLLPRLWVFQGGALENMLLRVTELTKEQWQTLSLALKTTGLFQQKYLQGINTPYFKFHPTLSSALYFDLSTDQKMQLQVCHRQRYYELAGGLYRGEPKNSYEAHAVALQELPNLLFAVHGALDANEEWATEFVNFVNLFLRLFGNKREYDTLIQRLTKKTSGNTSFPRLFITLSNKGEQLFDQHHYQETKQVYSELLNALGEQVSYERCFILGRFGRCFLWQGQPKIAANYFQQGLREAEQLERSEDVKRQMGALYKDLADAMMEMGNYDEARTNYGKSSTLYK